MNKFYIINDLAGDKWNEFVYKHPQGNIFQTPEMFEIYKNTKKWKPTFLSVIDGNKNVLGIMLIATEKKFEGFLGKLTARATVWGGPLVVNTEEKGEIFKLLLDALDKELKNEVIYVQFRNLYDFSDNKEYFKNNKYSYREHLNFLSDLTIGEENLWQKLTTARRNEIRKAEKEGIRVKLATNSSEIEKSYNILKETYLRIKMPSLNKDLFEFTYRFLSSKNMFNILLATYKDLIVGMLSLFVYKDRAYVWYAGSLSEYYNKHPNDMLYWEAMKWAHKNGYKIFDFGGAGSPDKEYGVREFKRQFGGGAVSYGRFDKVYKPCIFKIIRAYLKLRQRK